MDKDLLLIGKITKPHGVGGKVKAAFYADSIDAIEGAGTLYLKKSGPSFEALHIESASSLKGTAIIKLKSIDNWDAAAGIAGCEIMIEKSSLDELADDEYYQFELIGLYVETKGGEKVGKVKTIIPTGSNDVLVVKKGKTENLVPMTKEVIIKIDIKGGKIIIDPLVNMLEGL